MMRLDKYLAERTGMTRSESRKAITKGRVMVDGQDLPQGGHPAGRDTPRRWRWTARRWQAHTKKYVYIMLNKPEGVVSASRDKRDTTVVDLVAADLPPAGAVPGGAAGQDQHRLCTADR